MKMVVLSISLMFFHIIEKNKYYNNANMLNYGGLYGPKSNV